jgi:hypothetical protein
VPSSTSRRIDVSGEMVDSADCFKSGIADYSRNRMELIVLVASFCFATSVENAACFYQPHRASDRFVSNS